QILHSILKTSQAFQKKLSQNLKKHKISNLSELQIKIIFLINSHPVPLNLTSLQKETGLAKSTISKTLKNMQNKKLIKIKKITNQKEKYLFLTPKTQKIIKTINEVNSKFEEIISRNLANFYKNFFDLVNDLYQEKLIFLAAMCKTCYFFQIKKEGYYCNFLKKKLGNSDIKIQCKDWKPIK
ncbi:MAG: hypothetical protein ACK4ZM_04440, partial [bacterium]